MSFENVLGRGTAEEAPADPPLVGSRSDAPPAKSRARSQLFQRVLRCFEPLWVRCLVLVLLGVVVRSPALQGEMIWDDSFLAADNPFIKSPIMILEVFRHHLVPDSLAAHYRPVQNISYMFDYFVWSTNTYGFHLSNIFWHVGSGVLLYLLLRQLLAALVVDRPRATLAPVPEARLGNLVAFLIALLWIVHPVHSAAIDYISGRADSLAFFFSCGAWLLYLRARRSVGRLPRFVFAFLAAFALFLGLCSRESACMWLLMFLLHLFFFEKSVSLRLKGMILAACLGVVGLYVGMRNLPTDRLRSGPSNGWSAPTQSVLMVRALGDYARLMVFPSNLHMERTVVNPDAATGNADWRRAVSSDYLTVFGLLVAGGLIWGACRNGAARPVRVLGASWFVLAYLPISNLVELNATVAEHWLYLPSVGFLIFIAGCCLELPVRLQRYATGFALIAVMALSARSYVRSADWVSAEIFYRNTITAGGGSVRVLLNLGQIYSSQGKPAEAERLFRKTLQMCPSYLIARNNLAHVLHEQGKTEEADRTLHDASATLTEARKEYSRTWLIALNLAKLRVEAEEKPAALEILAEARREDPGVWALVSLESELLRQTRGPAAALPGVEEYCGTHWWHLGSQVALGKLYFEQGNLAQAEAAFRRASRLDVHDVSALNMIALLSVNQQHFDEAYRTQRRAIARQPDEPRQYLILSDILEKMGRSEEARAMIAQVTRMQAMAQAQTAAN